jgi:type II secretory pathway component GspD/PulD (secretin)
MKIQIILDKDMFKAVDDSLLVFCFKTIHALELATCQDLDRIEEYNCYIFHDNDLSALLNALSQATGENITIENFRG